jgi:hypothetical protein
VNAVEEGLNALIARGFRFQHLTDESGYLSIIVGSFGWPEFCDSIQIHDEHEAAAARTTAGPDPGGERVVWSYRGDALSTITALLELPEPSASGPVRTVPAQAGPAQAGPVQAGPLSACDVPGR